MNIKKCNKCSKEKDLRLFSEHKTNKDGFYGECKECRNNASIEYRKRNKDKGIEYRKKWSKENPEYFKTRYENNKCTILESQREHYNDNKEIYRARQQEWVNNNKAKSNAIKKRYKAAKIKADPTHGNKENPWNNPEWLEFNNLAIQEFYDKAQELSVLTGLVYHVDHIIPLQGKLVCGLHVYNNLQVLLSTDNISKKNKFDINLDLEGIIPFV